MGSLRITLSITCLWALGVVEGSAGADTLRIWAGTAWHSVPPAAALAEARQDSMMVEIRTSPFSNANIGQVVRIHGRSSRDGFAHLFLRNPDGRLHAVATNRRVVAGRWLHIPMNRGAMLVARRPAGRSHVTLVVTAMPLDFLGSTVSANALQSVLASLPNSSWTLARTHVDVSG